MLNKTTWQAERLAKLTEVPRSRWWSICQSQPRPLCVGQQGPCCRSDRPPVYQCSRWRSSHRLQGRLCTGSCIGSEILTDLESGEMKTEHEFYSMKMSNWGFFGSDMQFFRIDCSKSLSFRSIRIRSKMEAFLFQGNISKRYETKRWIMDNG